MASRHPVRPIQHRSARDWAAHAVATFGFTGHLPGAPGTWGTLATLPIWYFGLGHLPPVAYVAVLAALYPLAAWAAGAADELFQTHDSTDIVIDETLGFLTAMILVPVNPWTAATGFVLFRVFDIAKPWPCRIFDRMDEGGHSVVLDDLFAGLWTLAALHLMGWASRTGHLPAWFWAG